MLFHIPFANRQSILFRTMAAIKIAFDVDIKMSFKICEYMLERFVHLNLNRNSIESLPKEGISNILLSSTSFFWFTSSDVFADLVLKISS